MRNIKIDIEYDGTDFHGWQFQPALRTVQQEIQSSLKKIFQSEIHIIGAGRTDAGVHARGQVANFFIDHKMPVNTIRNALNGNLPRDIRIMAAEEVHPDFHARHDAVKRHYRYFITRREIALNRWYMWCYKGELDIDKMQHACSLFYGEHDFKAFCQAGADVSHYRCTIEEIRWTAERYLLIFDVVANRFLQNMVRIMVGTMINVGRGFTAVEQVKKILESRDRKNAGPTVPAKGLCLEKVYY